ncbi:RlpA-like double-psi beta-barrel-protein domain-containing protein-containing protein [Vararia minispora EC-137]|uniref:RlpA-like double-psi beta-barrel-protein domain-containing protein-containing protein n=1 Tax=Vararia minispora EC-137 TaxID=1314806 RepID=A0ACB8QW77_9AGAM|nr:RlpA-like double-psi beta-barrel-protein domain-containing protein-containing protein [Vararia minispora EC-137]
MVCITAFASALALVASVSGYVVPRQNPPSGWVTPIMENYADYHARYMALDCQNKHNTDFFTACCHPMKANETLATARAPECNPANLLASPSTTTHKTSSPASPTSTASSSGAFIAGGEATFFDQGGAAGSCGNVNPDSAKIVAVQELRMSSSLCGKKVLIINTDNNKQVEATVADTCPTCQGNKNSLDLSHGAFDAIADEALGVVPIKWMFLD